MGQPARKVLSTIIGDVGGARLRLSEMKPVAAIRNLQMQEFERLSDAGGQNVKSGNALRLTRTEFS